MPRVRNADGGGIMDRGIELLIMVSVRFWQYHMRCMAIAPSAQVCLMRFYRCERECRQIERYIEQAEDKAKAQRYAARLLKAAA